MNLGLLKFFFVILFCSQQVWSEPVQKQYANFRLLDKISNKLIEKSIKVNESAFIETLNIQVYSCFTEPPNEIPEDYVLIDIKDNFQEKEKSIYKGWPLANRGRRVSPRMLLETFDSNADSTDAATEFSGRVGDVGGRARQLALEKVNAEDWENMVQAMEDVVHRGNQGFRGNGTAWAYIGQDIDYRMAGKSGTAQVVEISQGEEYDEETLSEFDRKHAWFIAFAPVQNPTIALAVLVENGGGGSSVAAPVARAVIDVHMAQQQAMAQRAVTSSNRFVAR